MFYCPYCSIKTKEDEIYCISCGKEFPDDINDRLKNTKHFNRFWYIPILITVILLLSSVTYYVTLEVKQSKAMELYEQGEEYVLDEEYNKAQNLFEEALQYEKEFSQAEVSINFVNKAIDIMDDLEEVSSLIEETDFQAAELLIEEAENSLINFQGTAVSQLINEIVAKQEQIKVAQLKNELSLSPDISHLKTLLWEAEEIKNDTAVDIAEDIREQIVDYVFSKASEQLNNKQFSNAQALIEDSLKYVPDSEKIQSLKTTIEKEKTAFETAQQQRIEQAINLAAEEQEVNKTDAIVLDHVKVTKKDKNKLVVKGEVSSVATIPITSILIDYSLTTKEGNELLSNKVFVYPDKLFPGEVGKFDFTHYDVKEKQDIEVKVTKIRWYTDL